MSQSPMDYYNKQMLSQTYSMSPTSPFSEHFSPFGNDMWLSQQQQQQQQQQQSSKPFYVSPDAIMPRGLSTSPPVLPLDLDSVPYTTADLFPTSPIAPSQPLLFSQQPAFASPPYDLLASPPAVHAAAHKSPSSGSARSSSSSPSPTPSSPVRRAAPRAASGLVSGRRTTLPPKKTTHNMIEKRYRNNLNDKIAALRDAIPAMRVMVQRLESQAVSGGEPGSVEDEDEEDLDGLAPANKVNKATILSKATEYIAHLEAKNRALAAENSELKSKVSGLEMMVGDAVWP
ncbi:hypothetical protein TD95_002562 [Thielaviopsis punctulata]|uniref:BHLH domain-containing protein n=1 Tax=Thielaviopsis punctulata TaxID=72032 RepID=A0A0F4ZKB2_9PEZI|nr:hypothetical protein TD95_002562 [Thielaviopsis punctulata]